MSADPTHPIVTLLVDGTPVPAVAGQSVAAALLVAGILSLRRSPRTGAPRGAFCLMGTCQECLIDIDADQALACQVPARVGLVVRLSAGEATG